MRTSALLRHSRLFLVLLLASLCWIASAQQRSSEPRRPPTVVTANFTGTVRSLDASDVRSVRFQYEAGARSYWHSHEGAQVLLLEEGRGRAQVQGQAMQELVPGRPVFLPAGVPHWHGAAPDGGLTQIAVNVGAATFTRPVTDEEYAGRK
jgi:quercetin dioxygenase-like cupin family protein